MSEQEKKEFLFSIFEDTNDRYYDSLEIVLSRLRNSQKYDKAVEENNDHLMEIYNRYSFPNNIQLLPEELSQVILNVYKLEGNYFDKKKIKLEILKYILEHVSDESKIEYLRSDVFMQKSDFINNNYSEEYEKMVVDTITDEKREKIFEGLSKKQEAIIKSNIGYLSYTALGYDFNYTVGHIDKINNAPKEYRKEAFKNYELKLALKGIDADFSEFYESEDGVRSLIESGYFKKIINEYYNGLEDWKKEFFIKELSLKYGNQNRIYYDTDKEDMYNHAKIFDLIEDDEKYNYARLNILAGLLEFDLLDDSKDVVDVLLKMYKENPRDDYVTYYLVSINKGEKKPLDLSVEEIQEKLDEEGFDEKSLISVALLSTISPEEVKRYLKSKPNKSLQCVNALNCEQFKEVIEQIDDEAYKASLLLNINSSITTINSFFPYIEEDFVRSQIVLAKMDNYRFNNIENTNEKINNFLKIKEKLLELPEEERASFLCGITEEGSYIGKDVFSYKDRNEIKQSLLTYIQSPEDRKRVIDSFEIYTQDELQEYVDLTHNMIKEFFEDNCDLSSEQLEKMDIIFNSYDVLYKNYNEKETNGRCEFLNKDISLAWYRKGDVQNSIIDLLHEMGHSLANSDFLICGERMDDVIEEGMADTFAELVANHYFQKHKEVKIGGTVFAPELPLISTSSYYNENGWVKTLLYPLEKDNKDKDAIKEYFLGDKKEFASICMGEEFCRNCPQNYLGLPRDLYITEEGIIQHTGSSYLDLDEDSLYMIKNDRIKRISAIAQSQTRSDEIVEKAETLGITANQVISVSNMFSKELNNRDEKQSGDNLRE